MVFCPVVAVVEEQLITNKSLFVASSWSRLYLLIKDAQSFEHKELDLLCNKLFYCDNLFNKYFRNWKIERKFLVG